MRRTSYIVLLVAVSAVLCGCTPTSKTPASSPLSLTQHAASNYDLKNPDQQLYKVAAEESTTVKVDFAHKTDSVKNKKGVEYLRIMKEAPISVWKISEGESSPGTGNRLMPYAVTHGEDFDASVSDSRYLKVRILRYNFTGSQIVMTPKDEPADVIFLQRTAGATSTMVYFDIYLRSDMRSKLTTAENRGADKWTVAQVLEKCQSTPTAVKSEDIQEEIAVGASDQASIDIANKKKQEQADYRKNNPPDGVGPIPKTVAAVERLKSLPGNADASKKEIISKAFNLNLDNSPVFEPFYRRDDSIVINHASGTTDYVDLDKDLINVQKGEMFESASSMKLVFLKDTISGTLEYGSPLLEIEVSGKKFYYGPSLYKTEYVYNSSTKGKETLGVTDFQPVTKPLSGDPWCGFTPESKPAIYLYPEKPTIVSVKVDTSKGWMTKSVPAYPDNGWKVLALKSGKIFSGLKSYGHLFYETMLPSPQMSGDYEIIASDNLSSGLIDLAKRLSLNEQESSDLADYWTNNLPGAKYYQVGLLDPSKLDGLEPLNISPKPQTLYRVRLIFQPLSSYVTPTTRYHASFQRNGFTVVDWGGFVL